MTSLFSHYEEPSNRYNVPTTVRPELSTTGFIHMKLEEEPPMFSKLKINIPLRNAVTKLVVSNNIMLVAMANNSLLRIDLKQSDKIEELELGKPMVSPMRTVGLFLDPNGYHALVSLRQSDAQPELLYLSCRSAKLKPSSKARGHEITAVGWNHINDSDASTGSILLGTSKGLIFESEFLADTDRIFQTSWEKCWRDVFDIGKGSHMPIQGIEFHRSSARSERYFVLVTTHNRLYQFVGNVSGADDKPMLQHIFNSYLNSSIPEGFLEIPSNLKYSKLNFYYQSPKGPPKTFGWLTAAGIYHGNVDTTSPPGQDSVVAQSRMLKYPTQDENAPAPPVPLSFVLTQYHALLLYGDRLVATCLLNEETVFQDLFSAEITGKLIGIAKDVVRSTIWVYSERSIFKYKVTQEERNMWRVYMEKGDFEKAGEHCKNNLAHKDQVLIRKAETLFLKENYQQSAETYAETQSSFEEIALKFLQLWQIDALKTFLCRKLEKLKAQDKTQITMIVVWVIELFLNQLGQLRDSGKGKTPEYSALQQQFDGFMNQKLVQECVRNNCGTIYNLMASHGDKDNLNSFTLLNKDYERVIAHHIQKNNHLEALDILKKQGRKELFYQFAPVLMQAVPKQTVQALIDQGRGLAPSRLIPALVMCDQGESDTQAGEAVRYLEFCVHKLGCQDQAIHNYLLALYARLNPDKLMQYLASQGQDISMVNYDVHYALRLCRERSLTEACVQLSALLGLWEAAVDLALLVSVDLAKQTAALPQNDSELRKKLWLKIAQHVVEEKDDIRQAMEFLQQCDLIKIEDILPFFSDFVTIDHFKDAICNSLQEYNQHIQDLKEEMEEATKSAEVIREEIQAFRNRYAFVSSKDKCSLCSQQLLARAFFLFPCSHRFHMDCLQAQITPLLPTQQLTRLKDVQRQLASMTVKEDTVSLGSSAMSAREQVRSELDGIVAGECLYCGESMIRSIDKPFIEEEDFDRISKEWE